MQNHTSTRISHSYDYAPVVLLNLRRLPARLGIRGAAALLNFEPVAIRTLIALDFLKPLGNPRSTEHKYFSSRALLRLADNERWLHDATGALMKHWASKNARRGASRAEANGFGPLPPKSIRPE